MGNLFGGGARTSNTSSTNYSTNTTIRDIGFTGEAANQLASTIVGGASNITANALTANLSTVESQAENTRVITNLLGNTASQAVEALAESRQTTGINSNTLLIGGILLVTVVLLIRK